MERKRDVRKGEMGNVSERERGMRMMWKKERKEVKGWDGRWGKNGRSCVEAEGTVKKGETVKAWGQERDVRMGEKGGNV